MDLLRLTGIIFVLLYLIMGYRYFIKINIDDSRLLCFLALFVMWPFVAWVLIKNVW
jgi:hypothetical protein